MKIVGICGIPGSGKSTLVRKLIQQLILNEQINKNSKVSFDHLEFGSFGALKYQKIGKVYVWGVYDNILSDVVDPKDYFSGTDKLSMAVIGDAIEFLKKLATIEPNSYVIFEGDRLWCPRFIDVMIHYAQDILLLALSLSHHEMNRRFQQRNTTGQLQTIQFIRSRYTKYQNLIGQYSGFFHVRRNDNNKDQINILEEIMAFIGGNYE